MKRELGFVSSLGRPTQSSSSCSQLSDDDRSKRFKVTKVNGFIVYTRVRKTKNNNVLIAAEDDERHINRIKSLDDSKIDVANTINASNSDDGFKCLEVNNKTATATTTGSPPQPPATVDPDFMVILAALLCALICVLGLIAVARCAWLRRLSSHTPAAPAPLPPPSVANKGLKKKTLRSLPKQTFSEDSAGKFSDCAICLTEFSVGDEIRVLPQCGHGFHVACIDTWLGSHSSCPSCRQILMVARCQKCGGLPSGSSSISGGGGAETEAGLKECEDDANRFLP